MLKRIKDKIIRKEKQVKGKTVMLRTHHKQYEINEDHTIGWEYDPYMYSFEIIEDRITEYWESRKKFKKSLQNYFN